MKKLLIIDDEESIRSMLRDFFKKAGYEVHLACNGKEGEVFFRQHPDFIMITDLYMPEQEGLETIWKLKKDFPHAKIIAFTGGNKYQVESVFKESTSTIKAAKLLGASETFLKPVDLNELMEAVIKLDEKVIPKNVQYLC